MDQTESKDYCEISPEAEEFFQPILKKIEKLKNHPTWKKNAKEELLGKFLDKILKSYSNKTKEEFWVLNPKKETSFFVTVPPLKGVVKYGGPMGPTYHDLASRRAGLTELHGRRQKVLNIIKFYRTFFLDNLDQQFQLYDIIVAVANDATEGLLETSTSDSNFVPKEVKEKMIQEEMKSFQFQLECMVDLISLLGTNKSLESAGTALLEVISILKYTLSLYKKQSIYITPGSYFSSRLNKSIHPAYYNNLVLSISNQGVDLRNMIRAASKGKRNLWDYKLGKKQFYRSKKSAIKKKMLSINEDLEKLQKLKLICEKTSQFKGTRYESMQLIIEDSSEIFDRVEKYVQILKKDVKQFNKLANQKMNDQGFRPKPGYYENDKFIVRPNMRVSSKNKKIMNSPPRPGILPAGGTTKRPLWSRIGFKKMRGGGQATSMKSSSSTIRSHDVKLVICLGFGIIILIYQLSNFQLSDSIGMRRRVISLPLPILIQSQEKIYGGLSEKLPELIDLHIDTDQLVSILKKVDLKEFFEVGLESEKEELLKTIINKIKMKVR